MSTKSMAITTDDRYLEALQEFRDQHPGRPVRMEEVGRHIRDNKLIPTPVVDEVAIHTKKLKEAARRKRIKDQGITILWQAARLL